MPPVNDHVHTMGHLPPQLLAQLCSFSDIQSLKKIRLVNTIFAQIAAQYLFEGLCVTLIPAYLEKVAEVALHPTLRFYVRTLYFDYEILDGSFAIKSIWKAEIDASKPLIPTGESTVAEVCTPIQEAMSKYSQSDLDRYHTNFCRLFASQRTFFDGRMDLAILPAVLDLLPNLRTIESLENLLSREYLPTSPYNSARGNAYSWVPVLSDMHRDTLLPEPFVDPFVSLQPGLARPLVSLLFGLGLSQRQVHAIDTGEIPWSFWEQDGLSVLQQEKQPLIHAAFRHLKHMRINILIDAYGLKGRRQGRQGLLPASITHFIGAAPRLRLLDLKFQWYGESYAWSRSDRANKEARTYPPAEQIFAALTFPSLAIFRLKFCTLTEETMIDFTERHAITLKEVCMSTVVLHNEAGRSTSWERALKHIAPTLSLDCARLQRLRSDDIVKVILAEDAFDHAWDSRHAAYCQRLTDFLYHGGRTECPKITDFSCSGALLSSRQLVNLASKA